MSDGAAVDGARRRAALAAAIAGLLLVPWFWAVRRVADFHPDAPPMGASGEDLVDFYVANATRIPIVATLYVGQWVIVLVLLVGVVRAACVRLDLAAILAITLAGAATAVYVVAEGVLVWPVLGGSLTEHLDGSLAQMAWHSRDGLHAPAAVLLGVAVLVIAWLLARSDIWGRWVMCGLAVVAGGFALSSVLVGTEGLGPGLIFVLWGPVVGVLLLIGLWRRSSPALPVA